MEKIKIIENQIYRNDIDNFGLLDIYLPEAKYCQALLIYFHGGGLEEGDKSDERGIYQELAAKGIAVVSANYRTQPVARFPQYIEDAAKAVAWSLSNVKKHITFDKVFIGGISAGSYISMMLHFQPRFLKECGVGKELIKGFIFDAGQPTTHYNVLKQRGEDPQSVQIDEAAPLYYLKGECDVDKDCRFLILVADNDIAGRKEQNELLIRTMETHGYEKRQITYEVIEGYEHVGYVNIMDNDKKYPYADKIYKFICDLNCTSK